MEKGTLVKYQNKLWLRMSYAIINNNCCGLLNSDKYYLLEKNQNLLQQINERKWGQVSIKNFQESGQGELEIIELDSKKPTIKKSRSDSDLIRLRNNFSNSVMVNMVDLLEIEEPPTRYINKGIAWAKIKFKKNKKNGRTYKVLKFALFENNIFKKFHKVPLNIKIINY